MKKYIIIALAIIVIPLSASAASFDHDLYFGMRADTDVTALQELLTDQGVYTGPITGNFFSLTLKAVKAFQTANSVNPTGYVGPLTRGKINELLATQGVSGGVTDESGNVTNPPVTAPKTIDDVTAKLIEQINLLKNQLDEQKKQSDTQAQAQTQQNQNLQSISDKLGAIQQNTTKPAPAPEPAPKPEPVKEIIITASFFDPTTVTASGFNSTNITDGGNAYIADYFSSAQIHFNVSYKIDGVLQSPNTYQVTSSVSPSFASGESNPTKAGMYIYSYVINGTTKTFTVNVLPDPTGCNAYTNIFECSSNYRSSHQ